jgi:hypothetical protein
MNNNIKLTEEQKKQNKAEGWIKMLECLVERELEVKRNAAKQQCT